MGVDPGEPPRRQIERRHVRRAARQREDDYVHEVCALLPAQGLEGAAPAIVGSCVLLMVLYQGLLDHSDSAQGSRVFAPQVFVCCR